MLYGLSTDNIRITATRGSLAVCPLCKTKLVAKCGQFVSHHWAHESVQSCDPWHSEETDWHRNWKNLFPEDAREVVIGQHRADVKIHDAVIEFQHSPLSLAKITERQDFYHSLGLKVFWIFDAHQYSSLWWAEESIDRDVFYSHLLSTRPMWLYPDNDRSILHFGNDDMLWLDQIDDSQAYGFFIQRPILLKRFITENFAKPTNNLYQIPPG